MSLVRAGRVGFQHDGHNPSSAYSRRCWRRRFGRRAFAQARVHAKPKPLAKDAVTHDWTSFLGPSHNGVSTETRLSRTLPPPLVWEFAKGTSYTSPAVTGDRLLFVHRVADEEVVECLHAETGARHWSFRYATDFEDRYGYNNGPRVEPGPRRRSRLHGRRAGATALPRPAHGKARVASQHRRGVQGAAGFLRHGVDAARRRQAAHPQRGRAGRSVRGRARQGDRTRSVARGQRVGAELCVARSRRRARQAQHLRVRRRRVHPAGGRAAVDRSRRTAASTSRFPGAADHTSQ